jgi:tetratricopeptide (TPR) repeat protein
MQLTKRGARAASFAFAVAVLCSLTAAGQKPADPLAGPRALVAEGKLDKSEAALHDYLAAHPASADAHYLLGYVLFREQKATESLAEFTAGARARRPKAEEFKTIASDYVLVRDYADAEKWFTEVTRETPNDADAWYLLGRTKFNENSFTDAVSCFERAMTLHPRYIEAENNLGLALKELNELAEAKQAFQTAIDWQGTSPGDSQPFLNLGAMLAEGGDLDKAIPLLAKAAQISPENPRIHEQLGSVYEKQHDLPKAQGEFEQAVALAPNTSGLHFKLGQIYRRLGMSERAQHEFEICEKLNSTHSSTNTPNPLIPDHSATH